jgi:prolyl-tRNA synthetase
MKDLYSFSKTQDEHDEVYERIQKAYDRVFQRLGIGHETFLTFASGGMFSKYSHEYQTVCEAGEDTIYLDRKKKIAVNEEVMNAGTLKMLGLKKDDLEEVKAAEVGNIFTLKDKYSKPMGLTFINKEDDEQVVLMGCYGIGPSRLVGVITELLADEKGLAWPDNLAPFRVYLARIGNDEKVAKQADKLYEDLESQGVSVLYDDRDVSPGEKFADADLLGIPHRLVVSERSLKEGKVEHKSRTSSKAKLLSGKELKKLLEAALN